MIFSKTVCPWSGHWVKLNKQNNNNCLVSLSVETWINLIN